MTVRSRKIHMSYENKKAWTGFLFVAPWLFGTVFMFIIPLIQSFAYSLSMIDISDGIDLQFVGFMHYKVILFGNPDFIMTLFNSIRDMAYQTPLIIILSIFIACILNQKFKGRVAARAIFFLPVIIATGKVIQIINGEEFARSAISGERISSMFSTDFIGVILRNLGLLNGNYQLKIMIMTFVNNIYSLIWLSGIQILIFLAALQTIPRSAREAASIEGATAWEYFWKITLPQISPLILACIIYTVINNFTDSSNKVMQMVLIRFQELDFANSAAIGWLYFSIVFVVIGILVLIINRFVYYEVE